MGVPALLLLLHPSSHPVMLGTTPRVRAGDKHKEKVNRGRGTRGVRPTLTGGAGPAQPPGAAPPPAFCASCARGGACGKFWAKKSPFCCQPSPTSGAAVRCAGAPHAAATQRQQLRTAQRSAHRTAGECGHPGCAGSDPHPKPQRPPDATGMGACGKASGDLPLLSPGYKSRRRGPRVGKKGFAWVWDMVLDGEDLRQESRGARKVAGGAGRSSGGRQDSWRAGSGLG